MSNNPAVKAVKEHEDKALADGVIMSSTGVRIKFRQIQPMIIQAARSQIKTPPPPMVWVEDKGKEYPNPNDPYYEKLLQETEEARGNIALDAMIMAGVELVDPLPDDKRWFKNLVRLGIVKDLDPNDTDDLEFAYKKFVAVGNDELMKLAKFAGVNAEAVEERLETFRD